MSSVPVIGRSRAATTKQAKSVAITVSVDGSGTIQCSPDPVPVRNGPHRLVFALAPGVSDYVFVEQGAIVVEDGGADFPYPSRTKPGGKVATLHDCNGDAGDYKYSVFLRQLSTGKVVELDPTIQNEPE